jgi:NAD(P)-dependent dehydrogenase (short-subunit alcohol dehydrogenase family)
VTDVTDLAGQVAIVTGASRGIGLSIAARFVERGANVCITGRNADALQAAVAGLTGPGQAIGVPGRSDDADHRDEVVARVTEAFGGVDLLVNNVGINPAYGPLVDVDLGAARKMLDVNVLGGLGWVQAVRRGGGLATPGSAIVNVSSIAGLRPSPGIDFYGVTKAAVIHLTACLALELAPTVRVNAVAPAVVKTRFATALYEGREEQVAKTYPLGRLGVPDDVAGAVAFLCSADAAWITGQTVVLDGGLTLSGGAG